MGDHADEDEIRCLRDAWQSAVCRQDVDGILRLASDEIVMLHPGGRTTAGKAALRADYTRFFSSSRMQQEVVGDSTLVLGDWAVDISRVVSRITPVAGGEVTVVRSRAVVILRRESGQQWKVFRGIALLD